MKNGVVNTAKVIGIANRLRIAPNSERRAIIAELIAAIDDGADTPTRKPPGASNESALREMLQWDEIKSNPVASMRVAKMFCKEKAK